MVGSLILAIITFIVFMTSIKGVVKVNELIVPILIGFIFIIGIISIKDIHILNLENYVIRTNYTNFALSAVLYSSYNSILLIPVLITLNNYVKSLFWTIFVSSGIYMPTYNPLRYKRRILLSLKYWHILRESQFITGIFLKKLAQLRSNSPTQMPFIPSTIISFLSHPYCHPEFFIIFCPDANAGARKRIRTPFAIVNIPVVILG